MRPAAQPTASLSAGSQTWPLSSMRRDATGVPPTAREVPRDRHQRRARPGRLDRGRVPGSKFNGEIAAVRQDMVERGMIKVLDLMMLRKDDAGELEIFELSDLQDGELGALRTEEA